MLRSSFFWRLYTGYVLLVLVTATAVGLTNSGRIVRETRSTVEEMLEARARLLGDALFRRDVPELQARIRTLGAQLQTRFTIIDSTGLVVADSDEDPGRMDDHGQRPEVLAAKAAGRGITERFSNTLEVDMMYLALRVDRDGVIAGYVRTALPLTAISERVAGLRKTVALGAVGAALLALLLALVIGRRLSVPLQNVTRAAQAFASGETSRRVLSEETGELGALGSAFNAMAREIEDRVATTATERNRLRAILGGMVEGVLAVDNAEQILHVNQVAAKLIGVEPAAVVGRRIWEVTRIRDVSEVLTRALETGQHIQKQVQLVGHPHDRYIELDAAPFRGSDSDHAGAVVVLHDVTELRRLEVVRRDFVANVSHELKTPITVIVGVVETLLDDETMPEKTRRQFLERVRGQSDLLSALVTDLLGLARLESDAGRLRREPLDLRVILDESVQSVVSRPEAKELTVLTEVPDQVVMVQGDREALRQMTSNLLDNALKYTPAGGTVTARLREDQSQAVIEVEDTGPGIETQHRERIFERFYRIDPARSRDRGGTGLGLAIVKHICLAHDGGVEVDSTPGQGSTFRVRLPLLRGA